ncbi:MAG: hypothetical protein Q9167_006731 [Letrouitia subvulpina]
MSTSPPTAYPRKHLSPAQSYLHTSNANTAIGQGSVLSRSSTRSDDTKFQYPPSVSDIDEEISAQKEPTFKTRLKNQDQFQNDGHAVVPLLNTDLEWRYHAYREAYAHLLSVWDLPMKGCEILHYHNLHDRGLHPWRHQDLGSSVVSIGRESSSITTTAHGDKVGLELESVCSHHEMTMPSALDEKDVFKPAPMFDTREPEPVGGQDIDEGNDFTEDETWEDVAYESLARNLGGRPLTPKPSQIWRGEGRKRSISVISSLRRTESQ